MGKRKYLVSRSIYYLQYLYKN